MPPATDLFKKYRIEIALVFGGILILIATWLWQAHLLAEVDTTSINGAQPTNQNFITTVGVPLDDVYIHCRFAQNLVWGNTYSFNPNDTLSGDTSPLWVFLLALGALFTSHLEVIAVVLSVIFYLLLAPGVYRVARDVFQLGARPSLFAGLVMLTTSRMLWAAPSGMEVTLAALLVLLVIEEHARSRERGVPRTREGVLLGLAMLARPELTLLSAICCLDWIYTAWKTKISLRYFASPIIANALVAAPAFLFPYLLEGRFVSHSSIVQGARVSFLPDLGYLTFAEKILASNNILLALAIIFAVVTIYRFRLWQVPLLFLIALPILQAFIAPQYRHHGRYLFPLFPVAVLVGIAGAVRFVEWLKDKRPGKPSFESAILTAVFVAGILPAAHWIDLEAKAVRNINDQHLAAVNWIKQEPRYDTLAVHDVGAIGYLANRKVIDLTGLVTPALWPLQYDQDKVWDAALKLGASDFIIYDRLNPTLFERHKQFLRPLKQFRLRKPIVSAADTVMSGYEYVETPNAAR